jgi:hypothetical protein
MNMKKQHPILKSILDEFIAIFKPTRKKLLLSSVVFFITFLLFMIDWTCTGFSSGNRVDFCFGLSFYPFIISYNLLQPSFDFSVTVVHVLHIKSETIGMLVQLLIFFMMCYILISIITYIFRNIFTTGDKKHTRDGTS